MAQDPITMNIILDSFLVTSMYGQPGGSWPHVTIAACKIICTDEYGKESVSHLVFRSNIVDHAEKNLIEYLRWDPDVLQAKEIKIKVYINYSPCSQCSQTILEYVNAMQLQKRDIKMNIAFANFYKTHEYPGNPQTIADANIGGLKKLHEKDAVSLELLGARVEWKDFFDMSEFLSLTENEKKECLVKAGSEERKDREEVDKKFWDDEILVGELTSAFAASKISAK